MISAPLSFCRARVPLGLGISLRWVYDRRGTGSPGRGKVHQITGFRLEHSTPGGRPCTSVGSFDFSSADRVWTISALSPLTITPVVRCECGTAGHILKGLWRPA